MKDIAKFCDKAIAETKLAVQNIEPKLKAAIESPKFSEIDKTIKQNKRSNEEFNYLKYTLKPGSTISNPENKVPTGKPKISCAKELMRNSTPLQKKLT